MLNLLKSTPKNIFVFLLLISFNPALASDTLLNAGLVPSNIWFSKDPFYAGDSIRVYSIIFNGSNKDLLGYVNFYDGNSLLCTQGFSVLAGMTAEPWCDWIPSAGIHDVNVMITNARASSPGQPLVDVILGDNSSRATVRRNAGLLIENISIKTPKANVAATDRIAPDSLISSVVNGVSSLLGINNHSAGTHESGVTKDLKSQKNAAEQNLQLLQSSVAKAVAANPVLNETAAVYGLVDNSILSPLRKLSDNIYNSAAKAISDNQPVSYLLAFVHGVLNNFIFTTFGATLIALYLSYLVLAMIYRHYFIR